MLPFKLKGIPCCDLQFTNRHVIVHQIDQPRLEQISTNSYIQKTVFQDLKQVQL